MGGKEGRKKRGRERCIFLTSVEVSLRLPLTLSNPSSSFFYVSSAYVCDYEFVGMFSKGRWSGHFVGILEARVGVQRQGWRALPNELCRTAALQGTRERGAFIIEI